MVHVSIRRFCHSAPVRGQGRNAVAAFAHFDVEAKVQCGRCSKYVGNTRLGRGSCLLCLETLSCWLDQICSKGRWQERHTRVLYRSVRYVILSMTKRGTLVLCPVVLLTHQCSELLPRILTHQRQTMRELALFPLGRAGQSEEVACLIAFLLSDEASYILVPGTCTSIDGEVSC